jgi:hypothetical protein
MINNPDTEDQVPRGRLVLPAPPGETQRMYGDIQRTRLQTEQLIRRQAHAAPQGTVAKLAYYWRKDSAYKVLFIAIAMVLVAGIVFVSLASAAFLGNSNSSSSSQNPPVVARPAGAVDLRPTFPNPGGGKGGHQSSQPPLYQTPALQPTNPTAQPSPTSNNSEGTLTVQITNIPQQVANGQRVNVSVNTSEPGASVALVVRYNVQPYRASAGPQTTDGGGNATISWFVLVYSIGQKNVQATVYAVATDQNGQQAMSQAATVQISTGIAG